jgi:hypothetical protein
MLANVLIKDMNLISFSYYNYNYYHQYLKKFRGLVIPHICVVISGTINRLKPSGNYMYHML